LIRILIMLSSTAKPYAWFLSVHLGDKYCINEFIFTARDSLLHKKLLLNFWHTGAYCQWYTAHSSY